MEYRSNATHHLQKSPHPRTPTKSRKPSWVVLRTRSHFLVLLNIRCRNIIYTQHGPIISRTNHMTLEEFPTIPYLLGVVWGTMDSEKFFGLLLTFLHDL